MFSFEKKGCSFLSIIHANCNLALGIAALRQYPVLDEKLRLRRKLMLNPKKL